MLTRNSMEGLVTTVEVVAGGEVAVDAACLTVTSVVAGEVREDSTTTREACTTTEEEDAATTKTTSRVTHPGEVRSTDRREASSLSQ